MKRIINSTVIILLLILTTFSCRKREAPLPDNIVTFEFNAQGLEEQENSIAIKINTSRATDRDIDIIITIVEEGLQYGTDYTTTPAVVNGKITATIPSGNNETTVTVNKEPGALFDGDEKLQMEIYSSANPVIIGAGKQFTLNFDELVATASAVTIDGGGSLYPNRVFADLSANRQVPVLRTSWDLGFYMQAGDYRVILNSATGMMAKQIDKTDLTQVNAADTTGLTYEVAFSQTSPAPQQMAYIDHPSGDLNQTAIAAVSPTATDNKVYIINRGNGVGSPAPGRGWKKVRIIRNASGGYTLQHADIDAATFQEINMAKDDSYFFKYISFENGIVDVEPGKSKWDIAWTYFSNSVNFGGGEVPYLYQDIILQNRNVEVAKVLTADIAFDAFSEADITTQTFSTAQATIGSDWRSGGGPTSGPSIRSDRYYIIKDGDGNYYKIKFTALTKNGERGYPAFESVLVKRG